MYRKTLTAILLLLPLGAATWAEEAPRSTEVAYKGLRFEGVNAFGAETWHRAKDGATVLRVRRGAYAQRPYEADGTSREPESVEVESFFLDRTEVTNAQFCLFLNAMVAVQPEGTHASTLRAWLGPAHSDLVRRKDARPQWAPARGRAGHPVVNATGEGALAYAKWVGGRIPSQPEWEKAAGGRKGRIYPWGADAPDGTRANFARPKAIGTRPVGSFPAGAGPYGHLDMAGNVYDRVMTEARGGAGTLLPLLLKGGAWVTPHPLNLRVLDMCVQPMNVAEGSVGFRCAMDDPHPERPDRKARAASVLKLATDFADAVEEAIERRVPIFLSLQYDTCGQCDRIRAQLFRDPQFVRYCNEHLVVLVGHQPGDAGRDGHKENADDTCPFYAGLECWQHYRIFTHGLQLVRKFSVSPGNFVLDPDQVYDAMRASEGEPAPDRLFLVEEAQMPKWGAGTERYLELFQRARAAIRVRDRAAKRADREGDDAEPDEHLVDPKYADTLRDAVKEYQSFGNVDDLMRWVPGLCRVPALKIRDSQSDDGETHGGKLFWMFAKDREAYLQVAKGQEQPVGQVLVKEAWTVAEGEVAATKGGHRGLNHVVTTVERDGKKFHAVKKSALYVMMKVGTDDEDADEGWIYGTLTPDGKTVTSAGRVASCMECHQQSRTDRLFGLK